MKMLTSLILFAIAMLMVSSVMADASVPYTSGVLRQGNQVPATTNSPGKDYPSDPMAAAITITPDNDPNHLIDALLVPGTGLTITSVTFTGAPTAAGIYVDGPFGIANGIILASGDVTNALPPDDYSDITTDFGLPGCEECDDIIPEYTSFDAAILEIVFDVDDSAQSISFDFIFGSEEYPEWVGSAYNDVYGAYLNGVQISFDADGNPITINGPFFSGPYVHTPPGNDLEYDGSTTRLTTMASVTPGSTDNTLVFVVCDAGDYVLDSGVMLAELEGDVTPSDTTITGISPEFVPHGELVCGDLQVVALGDPVTLEIEAMDIGPNQDLVTLTATGLPAGATMTPSLPQTGNPVASTFEWTPAPAQAGMTFTVTFFASDSIDGFTEDCEYTFVVEEGEEPGGVTPTNSWIDVYCEGPTYNGYTLNIGDTIKAYDPDGVLCGLDVVREGYVFGFMPIYHDDIYTDYDEGAEEGDLISFMINDIAVLSDPEIYWTSNGDAFEVCDFYNCRTIHLNEGWNLISWNLNYEAGISEFASLLGKCGCLEVILGFDQGALTYDPALPDFSTLHSVDYSHGYWVKLLCEAEIVICGQKIPSDQCIPLYEGWNLASYWPDMTHPTAEALASIMDNLDVVFAYDEGYRVYVPTDILSSTLDWMPPLLGYWLKMSADDNLEYPGWSCFSDGDGGGGVHRARLPLADDGVTPSRNWMSIYGANLTIDGQAIKSGAVIEAFADNGTACGYGIYSENLLRFTPIYGNDGQTPDYPSEGERVTIHVDQQPVYPHFSFLGEGQRVAVARFSSEPGGNGSVPGTFGLAQNYPNPFNPSTRIDFSLAEASQVELTVFNVLGQEVATLFSGQLNSGVHNVTWDGRDNHDRQVSTGVYLYRLTAGDNVSTKKMLLTK